MRLSEGSFLVMVGGFVAALFGMTMLSSDEPVRPMSGGPPDPGPWARRVVSVVIGAESGGNYGAQNRNSDGAGLSYGLIQWTQKSGSLGKLLLRLQEADPEGFARIFGAAWQSLLATTRASTSSGRLAPVEGAALWQEPWTSRFRTAGRHPAFQEAQWRELFEGDHWRGAVKAVSTLGLNSERAYALCFDRSVHQGPAAATQIAAQVRARFTANGSARVSQSALLTAYAQTAAARLQRVDGPGPSGTWHWNPDTQRWHRFAGKFDLFAITSQRTRKILASRELSDQLLG